MSVALSPQGEIDAFHGDDRHVRSIQWRDGSGKLVAPVLARTLTLGKRGGGLGDVEITIAAPAVGSREPPRR